MKWCHFRFSTVAVLAALSAAALSGCAPSVPDYHYRLTVEVETPQGLRTGSSVIAVDNDMQTNMNGGGYLLYQRARGEAVAVDLPGGRTLFALLRGADGEDSWAGTLLFELTPPPPYRPADKESYRTDRVRNAAANRKVIVVPPMLPHRDKLYAAAAYPLFVTFHNVCDPKTVVRVDPDNLVASFGPGVKIRRITVQITNDPMTTGIEKRLKWLDSLDDYRTDPKNPFTNTLPTEIGGFRKNLT
jgi:hypothetical protein